MLTKEDQAIRMRWYSRGFAAGVAVRSFVLGDQRDAEIMESLEGLRESLWRVKGIDATPRDLLLALDDAQNGESL